MLKKIEGTIKKRQSRETANIWKILNDNGHTHLHTQFFYVHVYDHAPKNVLHACSVTNNLLCLWMFANLKLPSYFLYKIWLYLWYTMYWSLSKGETEVQFNLLANFQIENRAFLNDTTKFWPSIIFYSQDTCKEVNN